MGKVFKLDHYVDFPTLDAAEMAALVQQFAPQSDADALALLRANFAGSPLSMRGAALDLLMRRQRRHNAERYSPR